MEYKYQTCWCWIACGLGYYWGNDEWNHFTRIFLSEMGRMFIIEVYFNLHSRHTRTPILCSRVCVSAWIITYSAWNCKLIRLHYFAIYLIVLTNGKVSVFCWPRYNTYLSTKFNYIVINNLLNTYTTDAILVSDFKSENWFRISTYPKTGVWKSGNLPLPSCYFKNYLAFMFESSILQSLKDRKYSCS